MSQNEPSLSEQQEIRLEKLDQLKELDVNPYPYSYDVTHHSKELLDQAEQFIKENSDESPRVAVAGRVMTRRIMGKASFFTLQDSQGSIQVYIRRDDVGV
ncbi:MAG: OB-fold nucleic acid binding domain-containing protein, partial [Balneolaceae bacterium]